MRRAAVLAAVASLLVGLVAGPVSAQSPDGLIVTSLSDQGATVSVAKSASGRLAQSDPALLARTDAARLNVMVKLDVDGAATYAGGIDGLAATSPSVTGKQLKKNDPAVRKYEAFVVAEAAAAAQGISSVAPSATIGDTYSIAYGGLLVNLPARDAKKLLSVDGVVAVQEDTLQQPLTDATPEFIGATRAWESLGGSQTAGEGVIVGILDSGIWPEHPSLADPGIDHPGGSYACEFGDGTDPDLGSAFSCNDKLIGAYSFVDTYMAVIGALDGEYCDNDTGECSARDANGHGTHTATTAAGSPVESAVLLGVERGPVSGIAPGAHVIAYRVCLEDGCFGSDSIAAVQQAILDGVDVINFSISGGASAFTDPVELAFLDAYNAGILVNASAGNNGPGAATANHAGPWTNTVGASTSDRHFLTTLVLTADGDASLEIIGATVTDAIATPTEVILAGDIAGYGDALCNTPLPADSATGKVVACQRGVIARVEKSYNAATGDAAGMILYNPVQQGLNTDNHFIPSVHIDQPDSDALLAFLAANTGVKAAWSGGVATEVPGDVMASFSSRGPLGDFLKPDVTAPGVQILAGHTPTPITVEGGVPGELFQAIQGTSMSSPHAAGVSALVKAAHPDWTPGQVKSALMTSSIQAVLKEDGSTPATPYDRGSGSIRADRAIDPTVTFDVTAADYYASAGDSLGRVHLNLPSIQQRDFTGWLQTTRTVTNVSGSAQPFKVSVDAPAGLEVSVSPAQFAVPKGASQTLTVTISGPDAPDGLHFAQITLDATKTGSTDAVLPIALNKVKAAGIAFSHSCDPTTIARGTTATCTVEAQNLVPGEATTSVSVAGPTNGKLSIRGATGADGITTGKNGFTWTGTLSPALAPRVESIDPGTGPAGGYLPLSLFGIAPIAGVGDETITNFNVPAFTFGGETYTRVGMVSNGYVVIGGGSSSDVDYIPQAIPNPARPNNVVAPLWTDLNPAQGGAMRAGTLTDGVTTWLVLDWEGVVIYGTARPQSFQVWIGLGSTDDITMTYGALTEPFAPDGTVAGAENRDGDSAVTITPESGTEWIVNLSDPIPGGMVTIDYQAFGRNTGTFTLEGTMSSDVTVGTAVKNVEVTVE